jgi:hypothetical protein
MFAELKSSCTFVSTKQSKTKMVTITTQGNMVFLNFFNSKNIYSVKGFDTVRKASNYAKKYGYKIFEKLPENVQQFEYCD